MRSFENTLINALEDDLQAVLSFVYTGHGKREWHWYSRDVNETEKRIVQILPKFESLPIELFFEDDPEWHEYNAVLEGNSE